jgi:FtsZ-binding cell division protein ZapB
LVSCFTFCDSEEAILQLQNQRRQCEDDFLSKIALKEKEIEELRQKKVSFSAVIQHSNNKVDELEVENSQLQTIVKELEGKCETNQVYFNNQLEKVRIEQLFSSATQLSLFLRFLLPLQAYDDLHAKLEIVTTERQDFYKKYLEKEHENSQLMSFILSEGIQLPIFRKVNA